MQRLVAEFSDIAFVLLESHASDRASLTALGRRAARQALASLGYSGALELRRREDGAVDWPPGFTGSIAHTTGAAIAAVTGSDFYRSVGIDLEAADREVSPKLAERIAAPAEREALDSFPSALGQEILALFAAKESVFKCLYPLCRVRFWFRDVELLWCPKRTRFMGRLLRTLSSDLPLNHQFEVRCARAGGLTVALMVLSADAGPRATSGRARTHVQSR